MPDLDISDDSDDSDEIEKIVPVDGKLVREIVFDPTKEGKKVLVFDNTKGNAQL
jgi:replicative superfamily II helicase